MRDVKSSAGSIRAERAAQTRRRIEDAARARFSRDGYAATTLRTIAADAGVAIQTVYAVYGSKTNIVRALVWRVRDDAAADAAGREAMAAATVADALAAFAHSIRLRWQGGHDIVRIHATAAAADPELGAEVAMALAARRRGIAALAAHLLTLPDTNGTTTGARDRDRLAASLDAVTLPELYGELTIVHGWSADRYETWLRAMLEAAARAART